ncbi:putative ribonuclease H-like domain-containing protein [Tanacetum coccineum]|uniref:Ribonuclease H-like domain-containing protein n=1 Tax=Tanacetum coccineum TaxID=301880 RepID=A0ABQ5ED70_9ASTR
MGKTRRRTQKRGSHRKGQATGNTNGTTMAEEQRKITGGGGGMDGIPGIRAWEQKLKGKKRSKHCKQLQASDNRGNGTGERKPLIEQSSRSKQTKSVCVTFSSTNKNWKLSVNTAKASSTNNFSTARQNVNRQTILTSIALKVNTDNSHRTLQNKGIIDSGCSRHMTGNKAYLADFQDFNGGPVAFGGSKGYITGKGKIKTGIKREYSNARTPQQNGVAERKNRTLIEAARTMLADSFLPNTFWAEAVSTACYVLNRCECKYSRRARQKKLPADCKIIDTSALDLLLFSCFPGNAYATRLVLWLVRADLVEHTKRLRTRLQYNLNASTHSLHVLQRDVNNLDAGTNQDTVASYRSCAIWLRHCQSSSIRD